LSSTATSVRAACLFLSGGLRPAGPPNTRPRGLPPAPVAWIARGARSLPYWSQQPLRRRQHASKLFVFGARHAERARECLEEGLDLVVVGSAVEHLDVDVRARTLGEAFEEILDELGLQIADARDLQCEIDDGVRAAGQIDGGHGERLVHRHHEVPGAVDAAPRSERGADRLAERDA